jgi:hypothetical protein
MSDPGSESNRPSEIAAAGDHPEVWPAKAQPQNLV